MEVHACHHLELVQLNQTDVVTVIVEQGRSGLGYCSHARPTPDAKFVPAVRFAIGSHLWQVVAWSYSS